MVYYRKYRPQTIHDLDSQLVREKLLAILSAANLAHAFLFTGPKGLGKTSTARIVAKAVNCEKNRFAMLEDKKEKTSVEPCNICETCKSITTGINLDVIEIDAASNRGIDEMRELKEKINLAPIHARKKVYIIDEVHMLTTEAFNALLKTLEEPPAHAIFILCTTEQHKVPPTILSRCFHIEFQPASITELVRSFTRIAKGEKLEITDETLQVIASLSDGGFRDGTKLLEEVVALAQGKEITKEFVEEKLHVAGIQNHIFMLLTFLNQRNVKECLGIIEILGEKKVDINYFLQQVLGVLHLLLLKEVGIQNDKILQLNFHSDWSITEIRTITEVIAHAYQQSKNALIPQFPLELAVISWCIRTKDEVKPSQTVSVTVSTVAALSEVVDVKEQVQVVDDTVVSVASLRKKIGTIAKVKALYGETELTAPVVTDEPIIETTKGTLLHFSKDGEITKEWLDDFWKSIISESKKYNHTISGVLRSCRIADFDRKNLTIEAAYQFHKDKLTEVKTLTAIEQICKMLIGNPVIVTVQLKNKG